MYPVLEIFPERVEHNARIISDLLHRKRLSLAGVVKGCNAVGEVVQAMAAGGVDMIGDSRIQRFAELKALVPDLPLLLLRLPAKDEVPEVVRSADISLNSHLQTVALLNDEARRQRRTHRVILMVELGDIREGVYPALDVIEMAEQVESMRHIELAGIGTNLSCLGSVVPDEANMGRLAQLAGEVQQRIGRPLEFVSGGATSSLPLLLDGTMPTGVNHLRIGESILLGREIGDYWAHPIEGLHHDAFVLKAQVIELRRKPSAPTGRLNVDAFGKTPVFVDRGERLRAILAVGKADFVYPEYLIPRDPGIEVIAASSDHLTLDVQDAEREIVLGDVLEFTLFYGSMVHLSGSPLVEQRVLRPGKRPASD